MVRDTCGPRASLIGRRRVLSPARAATRTVRLSVNLTDPLLHKTHFVPVLSNREVEDSILELPAPRDYFRSVYRHLTYLPARVYPSSPASWTLIHGPLLGLIMGLILNRLSLSQQR